MTPLAIEALIILAARYGPQLAIDIIALLKAKDVTLEAVQAVFIKLKSYEEYNIPTP